MCWGVRRGPTGRTPTWTRLAPDSASRSACRLPRSVECASVDLRADTVPVERRADDQCRPAAGEWIDDHIPFGCKSSDDLRHAGFGLAPVVPSVVAVVALRTDDISP